MSEDLPETRLVPVGGITSTVAAAAAKVADAGGSPRAQIDAARAEAKRQGLGGRINYVSHQGKKQRERALARMAKAAAKQAAELTG